MDRNKILIQRLNNVSLVNIAKDANVSKSSISRFINNNIYFFNKWERIEIDDVKFLCEELGITINKISKMMSTSYNTILKIVEDNNIIPYKLHMELEDIQYLYNDRNLTVNEVSDIMGVSAGTMRKFLNDNNVRIRSSKEAKIIKYGTSVVNSSIELPIDDIVYLYEEKDMSLSHISLMLGVSAPVIANRLRVNGVRIKGISEIKKLMFKKGNNVPYNKLELPSKETILNLMERGMSITEISNIYDVAYSTCYKWAKKHNIDIISSKTSNQEKEIARILDNYKIKFCINDRKSIHPYELDIYIPDHNLAIEFNGIYWHSEQQGKYRRYHLNKTESCASKGVQLLHIFENEYMNNQKRFIWESVIMDKLGIHNLTIGARQTKIKEVPNKEAYIFLEENHLQGKCNSSIQYGLFFENELISVMTFGKSRYNKKYDYELIRFCSKKRCKVIGGASKLLYHFRKDHKGSIISYANRRWSEGHLYECLGFDLLHISPPNYFYWRYDNGIKTASRDTFQKHKLKEKLEHFDENVSEYQNMLNNGYDRIWDCGNKVYILS